MHIQDFFQNFLTLFLVGLHGDCTISLIAQDMSPSLVTASAKGFMVNLHVQSHLSVLVKS